MTISQGTDGETLSVFPLKQEPCEVFFAFSKDDAAQNKQTTLSVNVGKKSLYLIKVMPWTTTYACLVLACYSQQHLVATVRLDDQL